MMKSIFRHINILEKSMDAAWLRNEIISHNIANVDTPGYKKYRVKFEDQLKAALEGRSIEGKITREKHIPVGRQPIDKVEPQVVRTTGTKMRVDGNNVDIDSEMALLAKNTIFYYTLKEKISREFRLLKAVIQEGRR